MRNRKVYFLLNGHCSDKSEYSLTVNFHDDIKTADFAGLFTNKVFFQYLKQ